MKTMLKQFKKATCMFLMGTLVIGMTQSAALKGEVTQAANKNDAALKAYRELMTDSEKAEKVTGYIGSGLEECEFALIDLNKDGTKEMVFTSDAGYHTSILAYVNGKVKCVGGGFAGDQKYYPNKHLYYSLTAHTGDMIYTYYKFTGKKMKAVAEKHGWDYMNMVTGEQKTGDEVATYAPYKYTVKGKTVSKKKYQAYVKKLKKGAKSAKLKWHKNTKSNRTKYLN